MAKKTDKREQEGNPAPQKELPKQTDKYVCPKCGADIEPRFVEWLHEMSGVPVDMLKNGDGLKEIHWRLQVAQRTMSIAGVEINESVITEKALQHVEKLLSKRLSEEERERYEQQIKHERELFEKDKDQLSEKIGDMKEKIQEASKNYEKLDAEYNELKTKVISNPALKGALAHGELLEDLEGNFPEQAGHFEDISKKGGGDVIWSDIQINTQGKWTSSGIGAVIDSKDKGKVTEGDIIKLQRDMKFNKIPIGMIIVAKQDQLRLKETPCSVEVCEEGYIFVSSRENLNHHVLLRFVRDILVRKMHESDDNKKTLDTDKLKTLISDIMKYKEFHAKIKTKAGGILRDIETEETYIDQKIQEAWVILEEPKSGSEKNS